MFHFAPNGYPRIRKGSLLNHRGIPEGVSKGYFAPFESGTRKSGAGIQVFFVPMHRPVKRHPPPRAWWRTPFRYLLRVRPRQRHLHGSWVHRLLGARIFENALWVPTRMTLAKGVAIGMFIGLLPLIGLQILVSVVLCYFFRANIAAAVLTTFISNPFTAAGLLWMQVVLGHWLAPAFAAVDATHYSGTAKYLAVYGKPLLVGSLASAAVGALVSYPLMHGLWILGEKMVRRRAAHRAAHRLAQLHKQQASSHAHAQPPHAD
jgi:uncharacterized protein (DUF2062 family)